MNDPNDRRFKDPTPPFGPEDLRPGLPMILGTGWMADEMRATMAKDPDRYRPTTWGMTPVGTCTCCKFSTHDDVIHPSFNAKTREPDSEGTIAGCCCKEGAWGPKHYEDEKPKAKRKAKAK